MTQAFIKQLMLLWTLSCVCLIAAASIVAETDAGEGVPPKLSHEVERRQTVRENTKHFRLNCPVEGRPEPMIQWKKDGEAIGIAWTRFRTQNNGRTLRIRNVMLEDSGEYSCEAVNGFGRRVVDYTLIVYEKDADEPVIPEMDHIPRDAKVAPVWVNKDEIMQLTSAPIMKRIGTQMKLKCRAFGRPQPDVQWFKDGHPIGSGSDYSTANRWVYQLNHLSDRDTGRYTCRVYNAYGVINATFSIKVTNADSSVPEFDKSHPVNSTVQEGQTATFQCKVRSSVPPHIKWLKRIDDHTQVDNNSVITANDMNFMVLQYESRTVDERNNTYVNRLVIDGVGRKDSGWYICVVTNSAGHMVYRSAHLNVEPMMDQIRISAALPLALVIGIPVGILFLMFVAVAVVFLATVFLQKHKQKASSSNKNCSGPGRPPPPSCPPPSLPYSKASTSPRRQGSNGYYPQQRYIVRAGGADHFRTTLGDYRQYDPQAAVPLNSSFVDDRDLYEATPQPYEIDYEHSEVEFYPQQGRGRLQPHPSLYSCR